MLGSVSFEKTSMLVRGDYIKTSPRDLTPPVQSSCGFKKKVDDKKIPSEDVLESKQENMFEVEFSKIEKLHRCPEKGVICRIVYLIQKEYSHKNESLLSFVKLKFLKLLTSLNIKDLNTNAIIETIFKNAQQDESLNFQILNRLGTNYKKIEEATEAIWKAKDLFELHNAVANGGDVNVQKSKLLAIAVRENDLVMVNFLLRVGINVNQSHCELRLTPLYIAISKLKKPISSEDEEKAIAIVRSLLEAGAQLKKVDGDGNNIIMYSSKINSPIILRMLIQNLFLQEGPVEAKKILDHTNNNGNTALCVAVASNRKENVEILIENRARLDVANRVESTIFMIASMYGRHEILDFLIKKSIQQLGIPKTNALLNQTPMSGIGALFMAVKHSQYACLKLLLEAGVDTEIKLDSGETTLLFVLLYGKEHVGFESIYLLIQYANVNATDSKGRNPLMACAHKHNDNLKAAELILSRMNTLDHKDNSGKTVFDYEMTETMRKLIHLKEIELIREKTKEETILNITARIWNKLNKNSIDGKVDLTRLSEILNEIES